MPSRSSFGERVDPKLVSRPLLIPELLLGHKPGFAAPVIAAAAPDRINCRPNHDSVDFERRNSGAAENYVEHGPDLRSCRCLIEFAWSCASTLAKRVALSKLFSDGNLVLDC
jgi:hypothetical protein